MEGTRKALVFIGLPVGGPHRWENLLCLTIQPSGLSVWDQNWNCRNQADTISWLLQKMRAAPTSGTLPGWLITLKLVAELPIKQSLGWATEAGYGIVPASWLECGCIQRPFKGAFHLPVRCHDTKCSSTKRVLQRSLSLSVNPLENRRGVYLAAISEGWGSWKTRWLHAEFRTSP